MWLKVKSIAEAWGLQGRTIRKKVDRQEITQFRYVEGNGNGRGGKVLEINVSDPSIPDEIKTKIINCDDVRGRGNPESGSLPGTLLSDSPGPGIPTQGYYSDKAKKTALARMDLLKAWEDYRSGHPQKTLADSEFITAYNGDLLYKNLRDILGPTSVKTLYRWKSDLDGSNDWTCIVPGFMKKKKKGPQLNKQEEKIFLKYILNPRKFDVGAATRLTKKELSNKGTPTDKTDRTFRRFADRYRDKHFDIWTLMREGEKALKDRVAPYIPRDISKLEVGDVFVADGHRLNFQLINPFNGKPCRATLVGYLDWKSWDLAGYEIMIEENTQCIASALRNAIIRLGKINKIAYQDNGKSFKGRFFTGASSFEECGIGGLFGRLLITPVFAQPYNSRAKVIERKWREFSNTFEKLMPSYTGTSIDARPAWALRNEKFHKALHREYIPTIEEAVQYMEMWLEWDRSQPCPHVKGKTIGQVFAEGQGPGVDTKVLDDLMLGIEKASINRNGIRFLSADYYADDLYGMRESIIVRYSLFDLSYIKVYSMHGEFICMASRVMPVHPMAAHFGDVKDMEELKQAVSTQRRLKHKTIESAKELAKNGRLLAINWDQAGNVSPKIVQNTEEKEDLVSVPAERIPDEAVKTNEEKPIPPDQPEESKSELDSRPIFRDEAERYSWHLERGFRTSDDLEFKKRFEKTDLYRMSFKFFSDQETVVEKERAALAAHS